MVRSGFSPLRKESKCSDRLVKGGIALQAYQRRLGVGDSFHPVAVLLMISVRLNVFDELLECHAVACLELTREPIEEILGKKCDFLLVREPYNFLASVGRGYNRPVAPQGELHPACPQDAFERLRGPPVLDINNGAGSDARGVPAIEPGINIGYLFVLEPV
jgi:hypothetical protein